MAFDVNITFAGLCAFAFNGPVKGGKPPTEATVLMANLLQGALLLGPPPTFREAHYPQLIYDLNDAGFEGNPAPDLQRANQGLLLLYEEALEILPDGKAQATNALTIDNSKPPDPTKPATPPGTLWWLTAITDAKPLASGKVDPTQYEYGPSASNGFVTSFAITQGALSTLEVSPFPCTFKGVADFNQRVATKLALKFQVLNFVDFKMKKRTLRLTTTAKQLSVQLNNIEIEDFILPPPVVAAPKSEEIDFQVYFDLAAGESAQNAPQMIFGGPQSIQHGLCPPAAFIRP